MGTECQVTEWQVERVQSGLRSNWTECQVTECQVDKVPSMIEFQVDWVPSMTVFQLDHLPSVTECEVWLRAKWVFSFYPIFVQSFRWSLLYGSKPNFKVPKTTFFWGACLSKSGCDTQSLSHAVTQSGFWQILYLLGGLDKSRSVSDCMQSYAKSRKVMQNHAKSCKIRQSHAKSFKVMEVNQIYPYPIPCLNRFCASMDCMQSCLRSSSPWRIMAAKWPT